jgi:MFS family permease
MRFTIGMNRVKEILALKRNVAILSITSAIGTFGNSLWMFFIPLYFYNMGASAFKIAAIYLLGTIISILVNIPAGYLTDKYGRKKIIVIFTFMLSSSVCVLAISNDIVMAAFGYLLFGVFFSFFRQPSPQCLRNLLAKNSVERLLGLFIR